jgi:hypothetical protein
VVFEVGDEQKTHQRKNPRHHGEGFFDSVVTIGLGGLMGLSKGLATRRERDLEREQTAPPTLGIPKTPVKRRP